MNFQILIKLLILLFWGMSCRPSPSREIESKTMDAERSHNFSIEMNFEIMTDHQYAEPYNVTLGAQENKTLLGNRYEDSDIETYQIECIDAHYALVTKSISKNKFEIILDKEAAEGQQPYVAASVYLKEGAEVHVSEIKSTLESDLSSYLNSRLVAPVAHGECQSLFNKLFVNSPAGNQGGNTCPAEKFFVHNEPTCVCNEEGETPKYLGYEGSSGRAFECQQNSTTPPLRDCIEEVPYNSNANMDLSCNCSLKENERLVVSAGGPPQYFCKPRLDSTMKTYKIFFQFEQSDGCNILTTPENNFLPATSPIERRLENAPELDSDFAQQVKCAKYHHPNECGIISASPKVIGYEVDGRRIPSNVNSHIYLNHNFCGTTPPPPPPPQGDTCSLTGAVINGDCHANRIIRCAHNTDNGNYYYCTDEKSAGTFQWLNCSSDSTCGGRN
ncbi:MAG: hypothetical protein KBD78_07415 [Oligoflexales bacterium]|nr:hypothetical protein [Oligoflexales bacterium]